LSHLEGRALRRIIRYAICLTVLLAAGTLSGTARPFAWPAAALAGLVAVGVGPTVNRSARRWAWWTAAGLLAINGALIIAAITGGHGRAPVFAGMFGFGQIVLAYLVTGTAAMLTISGRVRRSTWLGEVDLLVLVVTLTALIWTLLVLLLAHDPQADVGSWIALLSTYALFDALVLVSLAREFRRDRPALPARIWPLATGAQMLLFGIIGFLAAHESGNELPNGWLTAMRLVWLIGLAVLGGFAILPAPTAQERPEGHPVPEPPSAAWSAPTGSAPLRRPALTTVTLLAAALLGPPIEIARPDFANLVMLLLVATVCLLLRDARRRYKADEAIRSIAVALAGAPDTARVLASTMSAADSCTTIRHGGIVVCANGPEGPGATATLAADKEAAEHAADDARPAARVDRVLSGKPHLTVVAPGQPVETAQLALGIVGDETELAAARGPLELLAAQAGHALDRVRLTAERSRRASEAHFQTLVRNAADVIMIVSGHGTIRYASPSARSLLGDLDYARATTGDVFGEANARGVCGRLALPYDTAESAEDRVPEYWTVERGRELLELEVRFADLRTDPTVGGLVLTIRDVTEQKQLQRKLTHLAFHDAQTDLGNSHRFVAQIEAALAEPRAAQPGAVPVVALLQINNLWDINNLRGLGTLDRVTVALARRLEELSDGAARVTGAVFGALAIPADHGCHDAAALARRLQTELSRPLDLGTELVTADVIVGAVPLAGITSAQEAISRAGLAMAVAKTDRRRPWRVYQPTMLNAALGRAALREDLSAALAGNGLTLHYQPVVDLRDGAVVGFEALSRWQHPDRGAIPPDRFVPLAEETGLIVPLGSWALRQAMTDLAQLRKLTSPDRPLRIAVNVSALQLAEPDFAAEVAAVLEETGVPAQALCLEITECSVLDESGRMMEMLQELKALGLSLAIDDFGTGHSALSYLPDLPFDVLKVDRSFITTINSSPARAEVVRGIVRIAGAVGMRVVAEGIEESRQEQLLMEASCHYGQGFLYSRPVPLAQAITLLDRPGRASSAGPPRPPQPPHARSGNAAKTHKVVPTIGLA
jgi:EAL domain-containing protein (putative c-di-GMP-specific phosphodiesterase class I)/GGDEF domain-containing protein